MNSVVQTLSCVNLSKAFGGVIALKDIRLSFGAGEVSALIGPNGAGKTTFLNVITGFISPDKGQCFLNSKEITHLSPHQIVGYGIARTFQDVRLVRRLSVLENVILAQPQQMGESVMRALLSVGLARQAATLRSHSLEILELVGLSAVAMNIAGELSYGQQKLLTLASCLATGASVFLLDEPFSGVDPVLSERLVDLLSKMRSTGKTVVFIEHDIRAVLRAADRVIVMSQGAVIADGKPVEILERRDILEEYLV